MYFLPEIVKLHLPECFCKKYSTTTLIIDTTEIYIEKPNNPEAQQVTFSSYKNSNTLKALVGILPKGRISFISTLYGGSISDKELTQKSGLIEKLQYGDVIMADRGFNIQEMLACKGVKVNVPPFMNESGQYMSVSERNFLSFLTCKIIKLTVSESTRSVQDDLVQSISCWTW